jgi:NADH-quinone oxidoreductase subunit I
MLGTGIVKGLRVTFEHMLRAKETVSYPEERIYTPPRFRGAPAWVFGENGHAHCVGCGICVMACPHGVIEMRTSEAPGKIRQVDYYAIHITRCLFCGLCVEGCPFRAIEMSDAFELASYERTDLVYTLKDWLGNNEREYRDEPRPLVVT